MFRSNNYLYLISLLFIIVVMLQFGFAVFLFPISRDAGYHVIISRLVAQGFTPQLDFPLPYSPGAFYILAFLGEWFLQTPWTNQALIYSLHLLNSCFLLLILTGLGHSRQISFFLSSFYFLWLTICEGLFFVLEPFQVLFALLSILCLIYLPRITGAFLAGLAAGLSLMMKQFSILFIPGLLLISLYPFKKAQLSKLQWLRLIIVLGMIPIPFLFYTLYAQQNLIDYFFHLTTFGGLSQIHGIYLQDFFFQFLPHHSYFSILSIFFLIIILSLLRYHQTSLNIGLIFLFLLSHIPLLISQYPHYLQLTLPWSILIIAQYLDTKSPSKSWIKQKNLVVFLMFIVLLPSLIVQSAYNFKIMSKFPRMAQEKIAQSIQFHLSEENRIFIMDEPWLWFYLNALPPDYPRIFGTTSHEWENLANLTSQKKISYAIFLKDLPPERREWLQNEGFKLFKETDIILMNEQNTKLLIYKIKD